MAVAVGLFLIEGVNVSASVCVCVKFGQCVCVCSCVFVNVCLGLTPRFSSVRLLLLLINKAINKV